jgi:energy-converting hydrogenase Eha subunit E
VIARLVAVATGVWLMCAPAVLGYGDPAATNDRIFGPVAAAVAFVAMWPVVRSLRWAVAPVAVWLFVAPILLAYDDTAAVLSTELSALVLAVTVPLGPTDQRFGGGWSAVWSKPEGQPS